MLVNTRFLLFHMWENAKEFLKKYIDVLVTILLL